MDISSHLRQLLRLGRPCGAFVAAIGLVAATILASACTTGQELNVGYTVTVVNQSSESATLSWLEDGTTTESEPVSACRVLRRGFAIGHSYDVRLSSSRDAAAFHLSVTHVVPIPERVLLVHKDGTVEDNAPVWTGDKDPCREATPTP